MPRLNYRWHEILDIDFETNTPEGKYYLGDIVKFLLSIKNKSNETFKGRLRNIAPINLEFLSTSVGNWSEIRKEIFLDEIYPGETLINILLKPTKPGEYGVSPELIIEEHNATLSFGKKVIMVRDIEKEVKLDVTLSHAAAIEKEPIFIVHHIINFSEKEITLKKLQEAIPKTGFRLLNANKSIIRDEIDFNNKTLHEKDREKVMIILEPEELGEHIFQPKAIISIDYKDRVIKGQETGIIVYPKEAKRYTMSPEEEPAKIINKYIEATIEPKENQLELQTLVINPTPYNLNIIQGKLTLIGKNYREKEIATIPINKTIKPHEHAIIGKTINAIKPETIKGQTFLTLELTCNKKKKYLTRGPYNIRYAKQATA